MDRTDPSLGQWQESFDDQDGHLLPSGSRALVPREPAELDAWSGLPGSSLMRLQIIALRTQRDIDRPPSEQVRVSQGQNLRNLDDDEGANTTQILESPRPHRPRPPAPEVRGLQGFHIFYQVREGPRA